MKNNPIMFFAMRDGAQKVTRRRASQFRHLQRQKVQQKQIATVRGELTHLQTSTSLNNRHRW
jgi:hypothetical protein